MRFIGITGLKGFIGLAGFRVQGLGLRFIGITGFKGFMGLAGFTGFRVEVYRIYRVF